MKYLFLDIDGVLNHLDFYNETTEGFEYKKWREDNPYPLSEFDPVIVKRINEVLNITGAKLVVSSSWRLGDTIELANIFGKVGLPTLFDVTPDLSFSAKHRDGDRPCRGEEIKMYLDGCNSVESFVIIDDDDDMLEEQKNNFVLCSFMHGLTEELKNKAISILNDSI